MRACRRLVRSAVAIILHSIVTKLLHNLAFFISSLFFVGWVSVTIVWRVSYVRFHEIFCYRVKKSCRNKNAERKAIEASLID